MMTSTINETEVYRMLDQITELKAKLARQEQLLNSVAKSYDEKLTQAYMSGGIKESTRRIIKEWQLFAGEKATENGLIAEQLEFTVRIAQDWKTRAEIAERRVAELEAQLAAQEWRSGDEVPHEEGWYQTFNWGMYGHLYFSGGRWSKYPVPPKHWRSVGPPPSGDDSPG